MSFLSANDWISSPEDLHVPGPTFDCHTTITVGRLLGYKASVILMCLVQAVFYFKKRLNVFIILVKLVLVFARGMPSGSCS